MAWILPFTRSELLFCRARLADLPAQRLALPLCHPPHSSLLFLALVRVCVARCPHATRSNVHHVIAEHGVNSGGDGNINWIASLDNLGTMQFYGKVGTAAGYWSYSTGQSVPLLSLSACLTDRPCAADLCWRKLQHLSRPLAALARPSVVAAEISAGKVPFGSTWSHVAFVFDGEARPF